MSEVIAVDSQDYTVGRHELKIPLLTDRYKYVFDVGTFVDDLCVLNDAVCATEEPIKRTELVVPSTAQKPPVIIRRVDYVVPDAYRELQERKRKVSYVMRDRSSREVLTIPERLGSLGLFMGYFAKNGSSRDGVVTSRQFVNFQGDTFSRHDQIDEDVRRHNPGLNNAQTHRLMIKEKVHAVLQATVDLLTD